jgi:hypothetical protein
MTALTTDHHTTTHTTRTQHTTHHSATVRAMPGVVCTRMGAFTDRSGAAHMCGPHCPIVPVHSLSNTRQPAKLASRYESQRKFPAKQRAGSSVNTRNFAKRPPSAQTAQQKAESVNEQTETAQQVFYENDPKGCLFLSNSEEKITSETLGDSEEAGEAMGRPTSGERRFERRQQSSAEPKNKKRRNLNI